MLFVARLYPSLEQAESAVAEYAEAGYASDTVAILKSEQAPNPASEFAQPEAQTPSGAKPSTDELAMAVRAGKFMGEHADFYVSRVVDGACLVVVAPPFIASAKAEEILDSHGPLSDSHLPPALPFVPWSEQATPFSNLLGLPTLSKSATPFSDAMGFGFKQEGLSHLSRWLKPLASDFTAFPVSTKASRDTFFPMSTKSDRLAGKSSSFGMGLSSKYDTPFSSLLGLPLLSKRKHFLTS